MKLSSTIFTLVFACLFSCVSTFSQETSSTFTFDGDQLQTGLLQVMGADFGKMPLADISYGAIPTDNAFPNATNGLGAIIKAGPGETALFFLPSFISPSMAMIRCSVRSSAAHVSVYIACVDQGENVFITTLTPQNGAYFKDRYKRLTALCIPGSPNLMPLIQIINTSETEELTVYLDNFESIVLDPERLYDLRYLDGDEEDPAITSVSKEELCPPAASPTSTPVPTSTFTPTFTPTLTPTATATPTLPATPTQPSGPSEITIDLPNLISGAQTLDFVRIPAGSFMMGSPDDEQDRSDNEVLHPVTLTNDFYMAKFELTQGQWKAVMGSIPKEQYGDNPNLPAQYVTLTQIQNFIDELNRLNLGTFRLPTDAEWEYACRAGSTTRYYWGDDLTDTEIDQYAWFWRTAQPNQPNPVGTKLPNDFGLYDMAGNVWEFCQNWYEESTADPQIDPQGPATGTYRVIRGGSFTNDPMECRSAYRQPMTMPSSRMTLPRWNYNRNGRFLAAAPLPGKK